MSDYPKKINYNGQDGRRMRMQSSRGSYHGGDLIVLIGSLQRGDRIISVLAVCLTDAAHDELVTIMLKW